jgi:hypothetical protein
MRWNQEQMLTAEGLDGIALRYSLLCGPGPPSDALIDGLRKRKLPSCATPGAAVSQHPRRRRDRH